ncbi:MAG: glycosyltransferase family 2 protein [Alistipes sp.]
MKTAVVILNWNGAEHLRRFLPAVVATTPDADIVVADNGSTDESRDVVRTDFPTVRLVELPENYGFAEGYNRALARLEGYDAFVLLNSDVEPAEGWLAPLTEVLATQPDVSVVAPKILSYLHRDCFEYAGAAGGYIDFLGYPFCRGRILDRMERDNGQYDDRRSVFWVGGAAMCCRADVFFALGGLCGAFFAHMEEIDFCWRVQLAGYKVVVEPASRVFHLGGGTIAAGSPRKIFFNHRNNLAMLYRCASPLQRAVVAVVRPLLDAMAAVSYLLEGNMGGFKAVWQAYRDFIAWHPRLSRERKAIRGAAKGESHHIYKGSVLLRYAFGRRRFDKLM